MKYLGIRTYDEGMNHYIRIMKSEGLTALEMLHMLDDLTQKLAVMYKLPVQFLTGMLHAGAGGDLIDEPTKEERQSLDELLDQIKKELVKVAKEL